MKSLTAHEIEELLRENEQLRSENAALRKQNAEYLGKWVAAQELAYNRLVFSLCTTTPVKP